MRSLVAVLTFVFLAGCATTGKKSDQLRADVVEYLAEQGIRPRPHVPLSPEMVRITPYLAVIARTSEATNSGDAAPGSANTLVTRK